MQVKEIAELTEDELRLRMAALDTMPLVFLDSWPAEKFEFMQQQWARLSIELRRRSQNEN